MITDDKKTDEYAAQLQLFMETINDLIIVVDHAEDFKIEYVNKCLLLDKLGYSQKGILGRNVSQLIHSDDIKKTYKVIKKGIEAGEKSTEIKLLSVKGESIWAEIKVKNFGSEETEKKSIIILKDISKVKKLEEDLKENEERFKKVTETIPEIRFWKLFNPKKYEEALQSTEKRLQIVMDNIPQYYLGCNENYAQEIGIGGPDNIIDRTDEELLWDASKIKFNENKEKYVIESNTAELHSIESWTRRNGEVIWIDVNRIPLNDSDGKVKGVLITYENITERKSAEEKRKKVEENLKKQHDEYRDLLETSTVGILEMDLLNNSISYINPKLLDIIGYKDIENVSEKLVEEAIHPDDLKKVFHSEEDRDLEFRILTKEGKLKWLHGRRLNQYNEKREIIKFRLWLEDITEKKLYEELIYELNINFLNFTTDIQQNIEMLLKTCLKLLNGELVLYVNKSVHEGKEQYRIMSEKGDITSLSSDEFNEKLFIHELFKENHDFTQEFFDIDTSKYAETDVYIQNYNIKACYGKLILSGNELNDLVCVFFRQNPVITNQNKLVLFLICDAIEIEERRWESQQHLEEQNKMLSEINRLKTDLFSRTSHELKTPLISIKGFTELLLKLHSHKFDSEVISMLEEIKNGSEKLGFLIKDIVESSQLEQGLLKLKKSRENLTFLINYCVKELSGAALVREQSIDMKITKDLYSIFDKERIYEVVSNLLLNAIKYTPVGGTITIEGQKERNNYIISISDTGIGLTKQERRYLFTQFGKIERYGQGFDIDEKSIEGTGLGLYISKEIIELHNGKIWAESEGRNKGSTFYFSLPITKN